MKVIQTMYIEYKTIVKAKAKHLNMSAICNEALLNAVRGFK
jgi:post-segregation antitoxin (ccd killing protein)